MSAPPLLPLRIRALPVLRRVLSGAAEVALVSWAVVALEALGRAVEGGPGTDVVGFLAGTALVVGLWMVAQAGHMPVTTRLLGLLRRRGRSALRRLDPPGGVAFRLPDDPPPRRDRGRLVPGLFLLALVLAAAVFGAYLLPALGWVRDHVSFTLHLLPLTLLQALYAAITILALLAARGALRLRAPRVAGIVPLVGLVASVVLIAVLPGWVGLASVALVVLLSLPTVLRAPLGPYQLYRCDPDGAFASVPVHAYLRGAYALIVLLLLLASLLAITPRLSGASFPSGAFPLTRALALSATAGAIVLLIRVGTWIRRIVGSPDTWPEVPLAPTLWWSGGDPFLPWVREARERGWSIRGGPIEPAEGADLVVAIEDDPRRFFPPDPELSPDEACFRLERRFHVVKRRALYRRFQALYKQIRATGADGAGYLFCPHAWPVPGVLRDSGGAQAQDGSEGRMGGLLVGPPYAAVFPIRLRRYLAGVLQALDLDVLYWEQGVRWADLRRVLGVLFETFDQGRFPVQDRHFMGLPRVRVLVQEPEDGEESFLAVPEFERGRTPPPLRARSLVIRIDGGGGTIDAPTRAPATQRPEPVTA